MTVAAIARVLSPSSPSPGHGPTPPEGGTYYHWWRDLQPYHYYAARESEFLLTYPAATHPYTRGTPPRGTPQFQLHKIPWVAVSSTVGLRVERRHHLQSVCLEDVVLVDQTDEKSGWSVLQHPPYSPGLAPSDFHLFSPLKQHLEGKHFTDDDDIQHEILLWMRQQPKEFYAAGIGVLIKRWDKCINIGGDYVEK
ncbi:hypothetical protein AVEN_149623-1 [Araneus ventricosus]|uniref:Histone-lysine N-methyltransferase SETMAR n=1 Tax=Araneus ventricosus TaxID=182803 RepID=A0A4Y2TY32_ARAVE|nr:hypothetical protein AVEN_240502-1 [Araneus ventricosus]GBO04236.1 hypothetical protein AVEN_149623-1 [Araneus ventricosus]